MTDNTLTLDFNDFTICIEVLWGVFIYLFIPDTQSLTLSARLECRGVIMTHGSLEHLGSTSPPIQPSK